MTELLIRFFIKNPEETKNAQVREAYGILAGCVGIACNLILSAAKFMIGVLSGSIAVQADAVNNLSDVGSSVVTLIGSKAATKPADSEHPYGHARMEYVASLVIAFIILVVGFELGKESIEKILNPTPVEFSIIGMAVLATSILVKLWMSRFTSKVAKRIDSTALNATTTDSICDVITTGAILISSAVSYFRGVNIDGYIGVLVACFVLYSGVKIVKEAISPLLGEAPKGTAVSDITSLLMTYDGIIGVHDVMIHSYGPNRLIASAHVEVSSTADIMTVHNTIDKAEHEAGDQLNILLTVHVDPVETDNALLNAAKSDIAKVIEETDPRLRFHDFRLISSDNEMNLRFDIVLPNDMKSSEAARVRSEIKERARKVNSAYNCIITVDLTGGQTEK